MRLPRSTRSQENRDLGWNPLSAVAAPHGPRSMNLPSAGEVLYSTLRAAAALPDVRQEVLRNHDDNRWWPLYVTDWRLRLLIPGWSARVSYHMIESYETVTARANAIGFDTLRALGDAEIAAVVAPIGLANARIGYLRSVVGLIEGDLADPGILSRLDNDTLVGLFRQRVSGAGYKVAQCAILYAKGYHCGIFPVDSGMKDMLGPCVGILLPKGPMGHEVMRKRIEALLAAQPERYRALAVELGYDSLQLPGQGAPVWWAHLVLIYFKRFHCNRRRPLLCPLRAVRCAGWELGAMCDRESPRPGTAWSTRALPVVPCCSSGSGSASRRRQLSSIP